jgi:tyrosyl-tRNA synthetase
MGREIQRDYGQEPQIVITMPLLEGTDGVRKMSKSYNNYIALNDTPQDMFGKIMSVSDEMMYKYYELLTQADLKAVKETHPKEAKLALAQEITERYHGKEAALAAREGFDKVFAKKDIPDEIEEYFLKTASIKLSDLLAESGLASSKNEARRLIVQGGVKIDSQKVSGDFEIKSDKVFVIQAGKRKFKKILPPK